MKDSRCLRFFCLACLLLSLLLAGGCGSRSSRHVLPPPEAALPPVPLQPGTGILSHEYQEQKVLPRMVRVASLPQKKAPGDVRQATTAMTASASQTMTVAAASAAASMFFMMMASTAAATTAGTFRLKGSCNQSLNDFVRVASDAGKYINTALSQRNQSALTNATANNSLYTLSG